jgi:hypothetical protein
MSAYQVFCKEYRVTIVADHPGIGKNLSELWVLFGFLVVLFCFYFLVSEAVRLINSITRQLHPITLEYKLKLAAVAHNVRKAETATTA